MRGNVNFTLVNMVKLARVLGLRVRIRQEPEEGAAAERLGLHPNHLHSLITSLDLRGEIE